MKSCHPWLLLAFLFFCNNSYGAGPRDLENPSIVGCRSGDKLYYKYLGTVYEQNGNEFRHQYDPNYYYLYYCADSYRFTDNNVAQQHPLNYVGDMDEGKVNIGCTLSNNYNDEPPGGGTMIYYGLIPCPIDDDIIFPLIISATVGFAFIRNYHSKIAQ